MKGLLAGLATGIGLAAALLIAAAGQAQGAETGFAATVTQAGTGASADVWAKSGSRLSSAADNVDVLTRLRLAVYAQARPVLVAILDTGIDASHEALAGKIAGDVNFSAGMSTNDINGHGTHVAGLVSAPPGSGVVSPGFVPNARLLNVKVADDSGICGAADVARAIVWAVDSGASVINVSLELRDPTDEMEQAVAYAWDRGALVIAAAGNSGSSRPAYPAFYPQALAVSASAGGKLAPLSNSGQWVDIAAPGFQIYSTLPGNRYGYETGTSFAAAQVSGLAALLFGIIEDLDGDGRLNDEVRGVIEDTALPNPGLNNVHGEVDFSSALLRAAAIN